MVESGHYLDRGVVPKFGELVRESILAIAKMESGEDRR